MRGGRGSLQSISALKDISVWDQSLPAGQVVLTRDNLKHA